MGSLRIIRQEKAHALREPRWLGGGLGERGGDGHPEDVEARRCGGGVVGKTRDSEPPPPWVGADAHCARTDGSCSRCRKTRGWGTDGALQRSAPSCRAAHEVLTPSVHGGGSGPLALVGAQPVPEGARGPPDPSGPVGSVPACSLPLTLQPTGRKPSRQVRPGIKTTRSLRGGDVHEPRGPRSQSATSPPTEVGPPCPRGVFSHSAGNPSPRSRSSSA